MIVIRVFGGLGNQLFQYAFGEYLKTQCEWPIAYDFHFFESNSFRPPSIKQFNFTILEADKKASNKHIKFHSFTLNNFYNKLFHPNSFHTEPLKNTQIKEANYYHGYWQDKKYSHSVAASLKAQFKITAPSAVLTTHLATLKNGNCYVSVHIRRTDYLLKKNSAIFTLLDKNYFFKAIATMKQMLPLQELYFLVFSDDITWAKETFKHLENTSYIEELEDSEALYLMSHCHHHILSNSTFSWWGAFMNNYDGKKVICPHDWFNGDQERMNKLVFDDWILC